MSPDPFDSPIEVGNSILLIDPYVMYIIVRESLLMGRGKIAAQSGHVVGLIFQSYMEMTRKNFQQGYVSNHDLKALEAMECWLNTDYTKIVKTADEKEWVKLKEESEFFLVKDNGKTEVLPGSETVIGFWPILKSETPKLVKKLQLLK